MGRPYEILLVDDGSTRRHAASGCWRIEARDPRVRVLRLRRNFGQTAAFSAGFDHARGDVVVTSDGDLQNDPADIPRAAWRSSTRASTWSAAGAASGRTRSRSGCPRWFANRLISWATGVHLHDYGCSLKAMRAEVVKGLRLYGEMHRFIPAVASWMGVTRGRDAGEPSRRARAGSSKYGIGRTAARAARPVHRQVPGRLRHAAGAPVRPDGPRPAAAPASAILAYLAYVKLVRRTRRSAAGRCCCWARSCS